MAYMGKRGVVLLTTVAICFGSMPALAGAASMRHLRDDDREERLPEAYQTRRQVKRERTEADGLRLPMERDDTVLLLPVDLSETDLGGLSLDEAGERAYREREATAFGEDLLTIARVLALRAVAVEGAEAAPEDGEALPEEVDAARAWRVTWRVMRVAPGKKQELFFIQVAVCNAGDPSLSAEYEDAGPRERVLNKFRLRLDRTLKRAGRR